jgi:hypothetical protein
MNDNQIMLTKQIMPPSSPGGSAKTFFLNQP